MDGTVAWSKSATVDSPEDSVVAPVHLEFPVHADAGSFHPPEAAPRRCGRSRKTSICAAPRRTIIAPSASYQKLTVEAATQVERQGGEWVLTTELHNSSAQPALMVSVKAVRAQSGDRILPALYSDNYVALMPGERRTRSPGTQRCRYAWRAPGIVVEGFNVAGEEKR